MFVRDPCGITCIIITYVAVFYADYVVIKWIVLHTMAASLWGTLNAVVFNLIIFLLTMSHFKAVISDPGTVPLPQSRLDFSDMHSAETGLELDWTICTRCETYRPPRAHHCRICKRCIRRMDHHCPWINNCVGERNQKYFIQFLIYVGILSVYAISLIVVSWVNDCDNCDFDVLIKQQRIMHSIILLLESALFGLFVSAILTDQLQAILSDETAVEQAQKQGLLSIYSMALVAFSMLTFFFCDNCERKITENNIAKVGHLTALAFISGTSLVFVMTIFIEQLVGICSDKTTIEQLAHRGPFRPNATKTLLMRDVCGSQPMICWIFPCSSPPPDKLKGFVNQPVAREHLPMPTH